MTPEAPLPGDPEAEAMRRRIAELEAENARLVAPLLDSRLGEAVRAALTQAAAAGAVAAPTTHAQLLDEIVETAAYVLHARAAGLFLVDEESGELHFEVALGEKATQVKRFRLPLGQGFAGFTATTGQALAVADVQHDERWAREIGQAVAYVPQTLLCVPLILDDRVIGVLELMDKDGGQPFSVSDLATAGRFAGVAASAIAHSRVAGDLTALLRAALAGLGDAGRDFAAEAAAAARRIRDSAAYRETLQLAAAIGQLSRRGDAARRLSIQIVEAINGYLRAQPGS